MEDSFPAFRETEGLKEHRLCLLCYVKESRCQSGTFGGGGGRPLAPTMQRTRDQNALDASKAKLNARRKRKQSFQ